MSYSLETEKRMSLYDYKIDFNKALGFGTVGTVYNVVKRPENEKNLFSYIFPYLYDYFYRVSKNDYEKTSFCIKILNDTICKVVNEPREQFKSNKIYREQGITTMELIKSNSIFSYFKTKVNGKTLGNMHAAESFIKRQAFVKCLRSIINANLDIPDLHPRNMMYDEINERWEIVDGSIGNFTELKENLNYAKNYKNLMSELFLWEDEVNGFVNKKLIKFAAKTNDAYSKECDKKILEKVKIKFKDVLVEKIETITEKQKKIFKKNKQNYSEKKIHDILFQQGVLVMLPIVIMTFVIAIIFVPPKNLY